MGRTNKTLLPSKHLQQQEAMPRQNAHLLPRQTQACLAQALLTSLPPTHGKETSIPAEPEELLQGMPSSPSASLPVAILLCAWLRRRRVST